MTALRKVAVQLVGTLLFLAKHDVIHAGEPQAHTHTQPCAQMHGTALRSAVGPKHREEWSRRASRSI